MLTSPPLYRAEFFALQVSGYSKAVNGFVRDSDQAAKLIWAAACALLEASLAIHALALMLIQHSSARAMPKLLIKRSQSFMSLDYPSRSSCAVTISSTRMNTFEWR